jgi:hypothetical protein
MKALFVCHDPPAPANNGGSIDMLGMLESLARLGFSVDLLFTVRDDNTPIDRARLEKSAARLRVVQRNTGIAAALALRPYQIASRRGLESIKLPDNYDIVIASDHTGNVFANPSLVTRRRFLRRNNDEALYASRMAASSGNAKRLFFRKEAALFRRWTSRHDRDVDQIWYVSTEELAQESRAAGDSGPKRLLVPSALGAREVSPVKPDAIGRGRTLYFGSLTVPINRAAVDWFVDHVHPLILARGCPCDLTIAGRMGAAEAEWAQSLTGRSDLLLVPNPADPAELYSAGGIFIDPLAHDAGIKLKILEAVRNGFAVVCHPASLYGSGLEPGLHALIATDAIAMAEAVAGLMAKPEAAAAMALRAQRRLIDHFDIDRDIAHAIAAAAL